MDKDKEKKIDDLEKFPKKLKFLILHSMLFGMMVWGMGIILQRIGNHLFVEQLPFGSDQLISVAILAFAIIMIITTYKRILYHYYYFKFLFQMLLEDLQKMATILYSLTQKGHIVEVDNPEDIKEFLEKIGGKKPDKTTLH